mmetsp:Transcript_13703/g.42649  ORF Transcript_13703/g.42649 Transcript_13703/m.42649 type:complete len:249 (-) Transcript_13703:724-1470(-)
MARIRQVVADRAQPRTRFGRGVRQPQQRRPAPPDDLGALRQRWARVRRDAAAEHERWPPGAQRRGGRHLQPPVAHLRPVPSQRVVPALRDCDRFEERSAKRRGLRVVARANGGHAGRYDDHLPQRAVVAARDRQQHPLHDRHPRQGHDVLPRGGYVRRRERVQRRAGRGAGAHRPRHLCHRRCAGGAVVDRHRDATVPLRHRGHGLRSAAGAAGHVCRGRRHRPAVPPFVQAEADRRGLRRQQRERQR